MKLKELTESFDSNGYRTDMFSNIENFMEFIQIPEESYKVVGGKIYVYCSVNITIDKLPEGKLPFPFGIVYDDFYISSKNLTSMENFPEEVLGMFACIAPLLKSLKGGPRKVTGDYDVGDSPELMSLEGMCDKVERLLDLRNCRKLTSFNGIAKDIGRLNMQNTGVTSLVGVADHIKVLRGYIRLPWKNITEGGLGLVQIGEGVEAGLSRIDSLDSPFTIIQKYMGRPDDIFECQTELIEHGFEEYAKL